ncbi:MAG: MarR family transcriptional regulator [Burkholderiaceae bacterium]
MSTDTPRNHSAPTQVDRPAYTSLWERPGYLVRRLHQIHLGLFADECATFDITPIQFALLTVLRNDQVLDQISLSTTVGIDRTSGADVIKRLQRRGLVERFASTQDRRAMLVRITREGKNLAMNMQPAMQAAQARLIAPLSDAEKQVFTSLMQKLIEANNSASRAPVGPASAGDDRNQDFNAGIKP